jgi:hypothetical protein
MDAPPVKEESLALISLKHDTCECTEKCAPCRAVRQMAIAEIEKLTAQRDQYKRKLTEAQQLAVRQGNEIRKLKLQLGAARDRGIA